jgi:hypothetical protein
MPAKHLNQIIAEEFWRVAAGDIHWQTPFDHGEHYLQG